MIVIPSNFFVHPGCHHPYTLYRFGERNDSGEAGQEESAEEKKRNRDKEEEAPTYRIDKVYFTKSENTLELAMELPGIKPKDVSVTLDGSVLKILAAARRRDEKVVKNYQREFTLDRKLVNLAGVSATLSDGILTIDLPRNPAPEPMTITPLAMDPPQLDDKDEGTILDVSIELPGVKLADMKVSVKGTELSVQATRKRASSSSVLKRRFTIPEDSDMKQASAYLMDGILTIMAPKKTNAEVTYRERSIPVTAAIQSSDDRDVNENTAKNKQTSKNEEVVVVETAVEEADNETAEDTTKEEEHPSHEDDVIVETVVDANNEVEGDTVIVGNPGEI